MTAAHRTLPMGSTVRVTNLATGQQVYVRITDRGPFVRGRILDLSVGAAKAIGLYRAGVGKRPHRSLRPHLRRPARPLVRPDRPLHQGARRPRPEDRAHRPLPHRQSRRVPGPHRLLGPHRSRRPRPLRRPRHAGLDRQPRPPRRPLPRPHRLTPTVAASALACCHPDRSPASCSGVRRICFSTGVPRHPYSQHYE